MRVFAQGRLLPDGSRIFEVVLSSDAGDSFALPVHDMRHGEIFADLLVTLLAAFCTCDVARCH